MAIAQVFINSSTSNTPLQQIPIGKVVSMDKYNIGTNVTDATQREVGIIFSMDLTSPQREIKLSYPGDEAAAIILRDASFAAIETAAAQTTV